MNKSNKILLGVLSFVVVCVVGYALFSETITVTGTATAKGDFDITTTCVKGISNSFKYPDGYPGAAGDVKNSTCTVNGETVTFNVEFGYPGSYQYYTLQFKNTGTMDALFPNDSDLLYEKATGTMKVYLNSDNSLYQTITLPVQGSNKFVNNFGYVVTASSLVVKTDGTTLIGGDSEAGRFVELSGVEYVRIKPNETLEIIVLTLWPDNDNNQVKDYYATTTYNQNFEFKQYTMDAVDKDDGVLCIGGC